MGNIAIRGLDGNRVQMLHEGVRLPDAYRVGSFSNASRNAFDTALVSRIEVLRGPASALHGSDALAGVLAVSTLDPKDLLDAGRDLGGFADVGGSSADDAIHRSGAVAATIQGAQVLLGASRSDGRERETQGSDGSTGITRTVANPQSTRGDSQLAKVLLPASGGGRWRFTWDRHERRVATDVRSLNPQSPRTVSLAADDLARRSRASADAVLYGLGLVDRLALLAYMQRSVTAQDTVEVRANTTAACLSAPGNVTCRREARFQFEQEESGASAIAQTAIGVHQLTYGAELSRLDAVESRDGRQHNLTAGTSSNVVGTDVFPTRDFPISRATRAGAFVQDEMALGFWRLIPALRYDRFEVEPRPDDIYVSANPTRVAVAMSEGAWSPRMGALLALSPALTLALQAAGGFRAPPYFDVNLGLSNVPLGFTVIPNPDLAPERSRGFEAALRGHHAGLDWSLTAYRTDYRDLILSRAPLPCPGDPRCVPTSPLTFQSQNVTRARIEGLEARAEVRLAPGWTARFGGAASRGDDRSRGAPLNSIDPPKVVLGLAWEGMASDVLPWRSAVPAKAGTRFPLSIQVHVTHVAAKRRIDTAAGALFATPAFTTLDLTVQARPVRAITLSAGIFNVFDRKHWLWSDVRGVLNAGAAIDRYTQPGRVLGASAKVSF
ncbi:MAG TPA: TonB-dependent receptor [Usitatibacter sp.]|nr:TonB-dependent receptor [Usitatibacter sp.]